MIHQPKQQFEGTGDMRGFIFSSLKENEKGFLYKVESEEGTIHYEVFKKETSPICIDFAKRIYSEIEFKYRYPKSNDFGKFAWCTNDIGKAEKILKEL